jgi:hypothetical protein
LFSIAIEATGLALTGLQLNEFGGWSHKQQHYNGDYSASAL